MMTIFTEHACVTLKGLSSPDFAPPVAVMSAVRGLLPRRLGSLSGDETTEPRSVSLHTRNPMHMSRARWRS